MFFTRDPYLQRQLQTLRTLAETLIPILIVGETGTGKELIARQIHTWSPRKDGAFMAINCGGMVESLFEAELFGSVKGAYTGSYEAKRGLLRSADKGTVFLDEIGDMPSFLQSKLLRVLQDGRVRPVGGVQETEIDIRVISATNKPLWEMVQNGAFRTDLYYRLRGDLVYLPPLRERLEDLIPLAEALDTQYCRDLFGKEPKAHFSPEACERLQARPWLGNVRELQFVILRARRLAGCGVIEESLIVAGQAQEQMEVDEEPKKFLGLDRDMVQSQMLAEALEATGGNNTHAARLMGVSLRTVRNWRRKYGFGWARMGKGDEAPGS